ncbi:putative pentatricopeptide repeat-containing protein [Ananas comosus]|uniref:Putative pentatricopeptide repeat-containing protein n=1 Tax=Ananas comosus TaxID=4615 RepID=A0A199UP67_ANACO|nr:putative pentatricopeptide repeat-containing protein [Ananas comosus]
MLLHRLELGQVQAHLTKSLKPNLLNSHIGALSRSKTPAKAIQIYSLMVHSSFPHDHFTYTFVLKACSLLAHHHRHRPLGHQVHARLLKSGHHSDLFVQNALLSFYSADADADAARRVFSGIADPDVVSWTSLVSALARNGCDVEAVNAFAGMGVRPNAMTLVSLLPACSALKALDIGKSVHGFCFRSFRGHGSNVILDNAILDMYYKCGDIVSAQTLFGEMPRRDVVSWTTMVSGFARNGSYKEAIFAFCEVLLDGEVEPNEATIVSVLGAIASLGSLSLGKLVHCYLLRSQLGVDGILGNALINMYTKCGDVGLAFKVFRELSYKDLVSWCTVIGGMAINGRVKHALQLFSLMLQYGAQPDGIVFLALLSSFCHAGLVDHTLEIFDAMSKVYGITPQKEHYTCVIDAYGRAGKFKLAEDIVREMPSERDRHVLGALLSAYKVHGGDEAKCEHLKELLLGGEVGAGGVTYALLSNLLADAGRWEGANAVRDQMAARMVIKTAACSWIQV